MLILVLLMVGVLALGGCSDSLQLKLDVHGQNVSQEVETSTGEKEKVYDDYFLYPGNRYAYGTLSSAQKLWYQDIEHVLGSMAKDGELSAEGIRQGLSDKDVEHVFSCVCMDHPELFFVDGFTYVARKQGDKIVGYSFSGDYAMERPEAVRRKGQIDEALWKFRTEYYRELDDAVDDYQKIKYVYETLIRQTDYALDAPDNQTIYSVLIGKRSVCQGYAKTMQFLCNDLGIECLLVQGNAQGQPHGWNMVKADGAYYYVDVTWGDNYTRSAAEGQENGPMPEILYEYLCVTTEEILKEHQIDEIVPLPECVDTADNYYVRENSLFRDVDEARLKKLFKSASEENHWQVSLKCTDRECYDKLLNLLLWNNKIFDYYHVGGTKVSYYQNEELHCITFWVTN